MKHKKIYSIILVVLVLAVPVFAESDESEIIFDDGRINHSDAAAPIAVYGDGYSLEIWSPLYEGIQLDNGEYIATHAILTVSAEQIASVSDHPDTNTLITATDDMSIAVYRLTTGEYQVNAMTDKGEMYTLIFPELFANAGYEAEYNK